jgi:hypothetical protein
MIKMTNPLEKDIVPSSLEEVFKNLEAIKQIFNKVKQETELTTETESKILELLFANIQPILPFIAGRILVFNNESLGRNGYIGFKLTSKAKFLLLNEEKEEETTSEFNHSTENTLYCLCYDLSIRRYIRTGFWSNWQNSQYWDSTIEYDRDDVDSDESKSDIRERAESIFTDITIAQLLSEVEFDDIIKNIIDIIKNAIEHNQNKEQQLSSRLEQLQTIQSLLV